jgi:hypothetical protein
MEKRSSYQPFWRINKSVLPLGITWEDFWPGIFTYLGLHIFLDDMLIPLLFAISFVIFNATLKRTHRSKALVDKIYRTMNGDHFYVEKNRSFKRD